MHFSFIVIIMYIFLPHGSYYPYPRSDPMLEAYTSASLVKELSQTFCACADFNLRPIQCVGKTVYLANIGNFSGRTYIADNVVRPIVCSARGVTDDASLAAMLYAGEVTAVDSYAALCQKVLAGCAVVFADIDGGVSAYAASARNDPGRSVGEPENEVVVRGPREGFVEKAEENVALLRKRLRTPRMKVKELTVGRYSETSVRVVYLEGVADETLVGDVLARLAAIKLDSVMDSGYIEQFLTDGRPRLFTEVGNSEKPDKVAAKLIEGRVAIVCDGSPVVLTVPYLFIESLQSAEDYLKTSYYATFIRAVRFAAILVSLFLPAFYIALMEHHKNAVPFALYRAMTEARENVPFSVFGELLVILLIFELIREVGIRMPGAVGDAVSIVGGLILGDAAISAGISSAPVIMVASLTAICTFILPPYMNSTVLVRLAILFAARIWGVAGIALSFVGLVVHLCGKTSFGVPYMLPFVPLRTAGLNDSVFMRPKEALRHASNELKGEKT